MKAGLSGLAQHFAEDDLLNAVIVEKVANGYVILPNSNSEGIYIADRIESGMYAPNGVSVAKVLKQLFEPNEE